MSGGSVVDQQFFVGPVDVSEDARQHARKRPRNYAIALLASIPVTFLAIDLLGELGAILFVLVPTFLACLTLSLRDSMRVRRLLRTGGLEEVYVLNGSVLTHELRSRQDPEERLAFEALHLDELGEVTVSSNGITLVGRDGDTTFRVPNSCFLSDQARQDFTEFMLQFRSANEERDGQRP